MSVRAYLMIATMQKLQAESRLQQWGRRVITMPLSSVCNSNRRLTCVKKRTHAARGTAELGRSSSLQGCPERLQRTSGGGRAAMKPTTRLWLALLPIALRQHAKGLLSGLRRKALLPSPARAHERPICGHPNSPATYLHDRQAQLLSKAAVTTLSLAEARGIGHQLWRRFRVCQHQMI